MEEKVTKRRRKGEPTGLEFSSIGGRNTRGTRNTEDGSRNAEIPERRTYQ